MRRLWIAILVALFASGGLANAAVKMSPKPEPSEAAFVAGVQQDLAHRFATVADAHRAGYFRFTDEDDSGSISYVNLHWTSADAQHPSQLWYDVRGNLLGADFSVPYTTHPPHLWNVDPRRWERFEAHIHWVVQAANGANTYDGTSMKKFEKAGGDPQHPNALTVVKLGNAKTPAQVLHLFVFPDIWDLQVWVKPNPKGAFADTNPLVKPSSKAGK